MLTKMKNLQDELLGRNNTILLTFSITDMFYVSIMFLMNFMPISFVIALSSVSAGIIAVVIMAKVTLIPGRESTEAMAGKLRYFPLTRRSVKKAQYAVLLKIMGIQLLLTLVPVIVTCFRFNPANTLAALFCTASVMLVTGCFMIELNLISFDRK